MRSAQFESLWYLPYFSKDSLRPAPPTPASAARITERGIRARARPTGQHLDHRQREARRLAGPGLGAAKDVSAHEHLRDACS